MDISLKIGGCTSRQLTRGAPTPPAPATAPAYLDATTAPYAAYGGQRMVSGYSGPLFTLRRDDGGTLDVSPQTGGDYPDYAAIDTWAGGNIPTVTTLHDQSGNGRHLTQATVANQPSYDTTQRFGNAVPILFDGFGRTATAANPQRDKFLSRGSLTGLDSVTMSAFMAMQVQTTNSTGHWFGSNEAGSTASHEQNHGTTNNALTNRIAASNRNANVTTLGPFPRFGPQAFGMSVGAGTVRQFINGTSAATAGASTTTVNIDRLTLGKTLIGTAGYYGAYRLFGCAFYASAVSQANGDAIISSLNATYAYGNGYNVPPEYNVLMVGDSITEGTGSRLIRNMASQLAANLTKPRRFYNWGIHGETMATAYAQRTGRYTTTFASGIPNVAFIQIGTNDLGGGTAGATLYSGTTTPFVTFLQGLGYKVVVCTLLPRANAGWTGAMETERAAYNAAVIANAAAADAVLDLTANPTMGPSAAALDTALYPDNLHPNNLGYAYLAGAPSGTYSNANTYYDALRAVLRSTVLGASHVP